MAALLTRKPVALQLLTLGLIKSISPSILIQVLSTAIRRVTERQGNSNRLVLTLTVRCVVHRESPPSCRVPLPSPGRERRLCMPGYSSPHACQAEARLMHLCSFCKFFLGYLFSAKSDGQRNTWQDLSSSSLLPNRPCLFQTKLIQGCLFPESQPSPDSLCCTEPSGWKISLPTYVHSLSLGLCHYVT